MKPLSENISKENFPKASGQQVSKEMLLEKLRRLLNDVQAALKPEIEHVSKAANKPQNEINRLRKEDREQAIYLRGKSRLRLEELQTLEKSPFFARCLIEHRTSDVRQNKPKTIYFGKHEFSSQNIYSWVAPIAAVRFESPGVASFKLPNGMKREVTLHEKDQYMIVDGKVMFYSRETESEPRQLIYQENFSIKKGTFMLPEIVEIMEKAQDEVIRASYFGPFAISGPAGSGKTTLALHRVAYLAQSPETAELYTKDSMIVFVQDPSTKEYFSHLLPELGIHDVKITTFFEWAKEILRADDASYKTMAECEFEKLVIKDAVAHMVMSPVIASQTSVPTWKKDAFTTLSAVYNKLGSSELKKSFDEQKKAGLFDRIDLTIALMLFKRRFGRLEIHTESNRVMRMGRIVRHKQKDVFNYSLVVVDEFQNYLPEQLGLLRSCLNKDTQSVVYVGDLSQRIQHGTIGRWEEFDESISDDRQIRLHKVYRNTKEILQYISSLGYKVEIPESLKNGTEVKEKIFTVNTSVLDPLAAQSEYRSGVLEYIDTIISEPRKETVSVGILGLRAEDIAFIKEYVAQTKIELGADQSNVSQSGKVANTANTANNASKVNLRVSTIAESQGVEFDIVCIVGVHVGMFASPEIKAGADLSARFIEEKKKIYKDLVYIGLTRAISEMHVLGTGKLKEQLGLLRE